MLKILLGLKIIENANNYSKLKFYDSFMIRETNYVLGKHNVMSSKKKKRYICIESQALIIIYKVLHGKMEII
jgi:hypothetical protein